MDKGYLAITSDKGYLAITSDKGYLAITSFLLIRIVLVDIPKLQYFVKPAEYTQPDTYWSG